LISSSSNNDSVPIVNDKQTPAKRKESAIDKVVDDIFRMHRVESAMQDEGAASWQMQQGSNKREEVKGDSN